MFDSSSRNHSQFLSYARLMVMARREGLDKSGVYMLRLRNDPSRISGKGHDGGGVEQTRKGAAYEKISFKGQVVGLSAVKDRK